MCNFFLSITFSFNLKYHFVDHFRRLKKKKRGKLSRKQLNKTKLQELAIYILNAALLPLSQLNIFAIQKPDPSKPFILFFYGRG